MWVGWRKERKEPKDRALKCSSALLVFELEMHVLYQAMVAYSSLKIFEDKFHVNSVSKKMSLQQADEFT